MSWSLSLRSGEPRSRWSRGSLVAASLLAWAAGCGNSPGTSSSSHSSSTETGTGGSQSCSANQPCSGSDACCGDVCVDTATDAKNCGACDHACSLPNAQAGCAAGACTVATCDAGFDDCDKDPTNGCETPQVGGQTACACTPGSTASCYSGPAGTEGVGACKAGQKTCQADGKSYGPCTGEVLPSADVCTDALDNDCNGVVNDGFATGEPSCICAAGETRPCYTGPANTENVGTCVGGTQTCEGATWGACVGEVTPVVDDCTDALDNDCNGIVNDGFSASGAGCVCTPGGIQDCYSGPAGTLGVGVCAAGTQTCADDGTAWGACNGEVLPSIDSCLDNVDNDCNGVVNDGNHLAPGCACTPGTTKCTSGMQVYCDGNGDWGAPVGPCVCVAGQFNCNCDEVQVCDIGPPARWVPKSPALTCAASQRCDASTGTCKALATIGGTVATGTYYQFATFTTTNSVFKGGYDVSSYNDLLYVNRGGSYLDVYRVTLLDTDGDGKLEPNQHPNDPKNQGPMEQRTLTFVATYTVAADGAPMGGASIAETYATSDAIYSLGPSRNGDITRWDLTTHVNTIVADSTATFALSHLGFGVNDQKWYGSNESAREVYSFCAAKKMWVPEFVYPNLAGSHMDGLEVVVAPSTGIQYVYVSDMTSDFLAQYRKDATGNWVQENLFQYADVTGSAVEGMGFGALNHFWATGGTTLYEIGGGDISNYVP